MNQKQMFLLRLRYEILSKKERKQILMQLARELWYEDIDKLSHDTVSETLNRLLIEKYGEMAVYNYLRQREKEEDQSKRVDM